MRKKALLRGLLGFPLGIAYGYCITILLSLLYFDGGYSPVHPLLVQAMGSEINAVLLQAVLTGMIGAGFAATSVLWQMDQLNIAKQSGLYFLINGLVMFPSAYFLYWMEHSLLGFLSYFLIFTIIFIFFWVVQFAILRYKIKKINRKIQDSNPSEK